MLFIFPEKRQHASIAAELGKVGFWLTPFLPDGIYLYARRQPVNFLHFSR